jgi:flagellar biogenesis protein FliO
MGTAQPHPDDHPPLPSWREKQIARGREIGQTYGALIAAILLCALLAWAIR